MGTLGFVTALSSSLIKHVLKHQSCPVRYWFVRKDGHTYREDFTHARKPEMLHQVTYVLCVGGS